MDGCGRLFLIRFYDAPLIYCCSSVHYFVKPKRLLLIFSEFWSTSSLLIWIYYCKILFPIHVCWRSAWPSGSSMWMDMDRRWWTDGRTDVFGLICWLMFWSALGGTMAQKGSPKRLKIQIISRLQEHLRGVFRYIWVRFCIQFGWLWEHFGNILAAVSGQRWPDIARCTKKWRDANRYGWIYLMHLDMAR